VRDAVISIRRRKLPDPVEIGNAGSFFKNPVIPGEQLVILQNDFPGIPFYPHMQEKSRTAAAQTGPVHGTGHGQSKDSGQVKVPAAWLIEQCGWKGYRNGDAGVHADQPLVLVNYGTATGKQILDLSTRIMESVHQKFGIRLEREVNVID
jgi:UDP-N-acetylmuramate dehydrogenase